MCRLNLFKFRIEVLKIKRKPNSPPPPLGPSILTQPELRSRLQNFGMRICELILEPPSSQVHRVDCLEEIVERLRAEQVERLESDAEL
jgi:hypothetical protein